MITYAAVIFFAIFVVGMVLVDRARVRYAKMLLRHHRDTTTLCDDIIAKYVHPSERQACQNILHEHMYRQMHELTGGKAR